MNKNIFRAYDIRGIFEKDFTLNDACKIGQAYGSYLIKTYPQIKPQDLKVCVGKDGRTHGQAIHQKFMEGVQLTGIQVFDIGFSFSPLLLFSTCYGKFDGGVNITASHNPKEYNGFKLQKRKAHAIYGDEIQKIAEMIDQDDLTYATQTQKIEKISFWSEYKEKIKSISKNHHKKKIVVDAGNGITGMFVPELFQEMGYEVVKLFCEVDGNFPNHEADPENKDNLKDLQKKVLAEKALLGIAFDGDGDRVGIVDQEGTIFDADHLLILLAKDLLKRHPQAKVVCTVTASSIVRDEIEKAGGKTIESKVGHSFVEDMMSKEKALLGGESSGHLFFGENYYGYDDAVLAAVKILEIVNRTPIPLKDHFKDLAKIYVSEEVKIYVPEEKKFLLMEKIKDYFTEKYQCSCIDGVKVFFDENSWAICRASNTSPKISFRCEAKEKKELDKIFFKMNNVVLEIKKIY